MTIQWFPGHMEKARREVENTLKHVDIVFELIDARAPQSSQNPILQDIIKDKLRLTILMKKDLADQIATEKWLKYFQTTNNQTIAVDCNDHKDIQKVIQAAKNLGTHVAKRRLRALILGIPNVGKSTLINRLAHKRSEEHTSELQSRGHLVCRLLLEKKKNKEHNHYV